MSWMSDKYNYIQQSKSLQNFLLSLIKKKKDFTTKIIILNIKKEKQNILTEQQLNEESHDTTLFKLVDLLT